MAPWLVCSAPDQAGQVRSHAGDIVLCSWARHFIITVLLSTQLYKQVHLDLHYLYLDYPDFSMIQTFFVVPILS